MSPDTEELERLRTRIEELEAELRRFEMVEGELSRQAFELEAEVAARQQAEEGLARERDNARAIFESAPVPLILVDRSCRVVAANRAMERLSPLAADQMIGSVPGQLLGCAHVSDISRSCGQSPACLSCRLKMLVRGVIADGVPRLDVELVNAKKDEAGGVSDQYLKVSLQPMNIGGERHAVIAIADVTDRKMLERRLVEERERLTVTLRSIGDGVIATDEQGRITLMNGMAARLTGWSLDEAVGKPWEQVFVVDEKNRPRRDIVRETIESRRVGSLSGSTLLTGRDGRVWPISDSVAPIERDDGRIIGSVIVFRDMTEKFAMQDEILRRRKLDALGVLAGGIAHDFNNLLTGIVGNVSIAIRRSDDPSVIEPLQRVLSVVERSTALTRQLLTFSKGGAPVKETLEIPGIVEDAARFVLRGSPVALDFRADPDLPPCDVDAGQFSQVIENLVINAKQAMPDGGTITISLTSEEVVEGSYRLEPGRYVKIRITDQGVGIPQDLLPRIFDPYFTTKEHGSGLGLATVWSIMERHGGRVEVDSTPGEGTTFTLYLRGSTRPVAAARGDGGEGAFQTPSVIRLLVMDDESIIRDLVSDMLKMLGDRVDTASDGSEAVRLVQESVRTGKRYDVALLDLTIPGGMGGVETFGRLREIDPGLKGIVMSGYGTEPVMGDYRAHGFDAALPKPFTIVQLQRVLASVVGPHGPGDPGGDSNVSG